MSGTAAGLERRRVCHVVYGRYPSDPRVRREVETLADAGYRVDVLCVRAEGEAGSSLLGSVQVFRLPLRTRRGSRMRYAYQYAVFCLLVAAWLLRFGGRRRYSVVHVHSLPDFAVVAALSARLRGTRLVLDLHESMPELFRARFQTDAASILYRIAVAAQRVSCWLANRVVTVNGTIAALLEGRGIRSTHVVVVENSPRWTPSSEVADDASSSPGPEVVIVGGLNEERDFDTVLRAAALLREFRDLRWRIIGRGDRAYVDHLAGLRDQLGLQARVSIEPEVDSSRVLSLLRKTTLGVVSYERNPLTEIATPNKAYEYAACGKPMIVADLPALRRLFGDSVLYYVPGDATSLSESIRSLLQDQVLLGSLGRKAKQVHELHRWPLMADRLLSMYRVLAGPFTREGGA